MNIIVTHTLAPEIIELLQNFNTERIASPEQVKETAPVKEIKAKKTVVKSEPELMKEPVEETTEETTEEITKEPTTFEEIRLLVQEKAQAGKRDGVKKILAEFGAEKVSALKKDQYNDFFTKVDNL